MKMGLSALKNVQGLTFYKILGSGVRNGFSAIPNFGTYVLLCVWESEADSSKFFKEHPFFKTYQKRSVENFTVYLHFAESHGVWDGTQPFTKNCKLSLDKPVLILTRASIRLNKLWSFWNKVGKVSKSLNHYDDVVLSIGVGEWPLIQQATLSIWRTQSEMLDYAYKNPKHKEVVLLSRKLNWYKEEMFARFVPYKFEGTWEGNDVENLV
ncbi:MAG: spheroidene monooxygenase [Mongoliibacter sp.]|nr:MAG: spheroidene monooxygenase [Mongoliibacter sp.]